MKTSVTYFVFTTRAFVSVRRWIYYSVNFAKKGTTNLAKVVKDMRGTPQPWPTQKNLLAP